MPGAVTVFFRFDDYSATSIPSVEAGLVGALRRNRASATFGVIPAVTDGRYHDAGERGVQFLSDEKIRFLREAMADGTVDVALHGWDHRTQAAAPPHSEFVGLDLAAQVAKLQSGRESLKRWLGLEPRVFVPPWNRYDATTLQALEQLGFACISANRYGLAGQCSLLFVPITAEMNELRGAVARAAASQDSDSMIGVLLHPYDFKESGDNRGVMSCADFDAELRWLAEQPNVRVASLTTLVNEQAKLGLERYRANQPLPFEAITPPWTSTTSGTPFFQSEQTAKLARLRRSLSIIATHAAAVVAGVVLGGLIDSSYMRYAAAAAVAALLLRSAVNREVHFRTMLLLMFLVGVMLS